MVGTINDYAVIVNNVLKHVAPKVSFGPVVAEDIPAVIEGLRAFV